MAWSTDFTHHLWTSSRYAPRYLLEQVRVPVQAARPFGSPVRLSSFPIGSYIPGITMAGSSFSGGVLSLRDWSCSPLMFSIGITGESIGVKGIRRLLQRGQAVVLKVGFTDDPADFQPVALGTIYGVSRSGDGWSIQCRGLEGSLTSRITRTVGRQSLGHSLASGTVSSNYTASDATIVVTGTDPGAWLQDGSTNAVLRVTDDNGADFFITFDPSAVTGVGPYTITVITAGAFGTTDANATAGNAIAEMMHVYDHPVKTIEKILASSGAGTNGLADTLPGSWGFGIPAAHIASRDIQRFSEITQPSSGADGWHWVQPEIESPQDTIAGWANPCGYFITQARGGITARGAVEPWLWNTPGNFTITDGMIIPESLRYEAWNPDTPVEYTKTRILYTDGTTAQTSATSDLDHIPGFGVLAHTAGGVWSATANASAITADLVTRLKHWDQRTAEILSFDLIGWGPGVAAPGDIVTLNIGSITSRDGSTFNGRAAMVLRCSPNWFGAHTQMEVAVLPADETVPWAVPA